MKLIKSLVLSSLLLGSFGVNAHSLTITNETNQFISFKIAGACIDGFGLTVPAHAKTFVTQHTFDRFCNYTVKQCVINAFYTGNCTGNHIADISVDSVQGVTKIDQKADSDNNTHVSANKFLLLFEPRP